MLFYAGEDAQEDDSDFLTNVTRTQTSKVLGFGKGSVTHGRDSRYWDKDDRRRDEDYNEDSSHVPVEVSNEYLQKGHHVLDADDEYDDGLDSQQTQMDEYDDTNAHQDQALPHTGINYENVSNKVPTHNSRNLDQVDTNSRHPSKRSRSDSKRKAKRRKFSGKISLSINCCKCVTFFCSFTTLLQYRIEVSTTDKVDSYCKLVIFGERPLHSPIFSLLFLFPVTWRKKVKRLKTTKAIYFHVLDVFPTSD